MPPAGSPAHLRKGRVRPDLVLCSSALRTRETLEIARAGLPDEVAVRIEDRIYGATASELLALVHELPDTADCVMLVGHNPGLEDLVLGLAGNGDDALVARVEAKFPTGALATLDADVATWSEITAGGAALTAYAVPKDLP